jgi:hypothetical protein
MSALVNTRPQGSLWRTALRMSGGILLSLILWECIVRCCINRQVTGRWIPQYGVTTSGLVVFGTEGYSLTHFNSLGFRGPEPQPKRPGEYRILVVGDSFVVGLQVPDKDTFGQQLQTCAQQAGWKDVTVSNGGRSGFGPADYVALAPFYRNTFHPDLCVIEINPDDFDKDFANPSQTYYCVKSGSDDYVIQSHITGSATEVSHRSRVRALLSTLAQDWQSKVYAKHRLEIARKPYVRPQPQPPADYDRMTGWFARQIKQQYGNPVVLYIPRIEYFHPNDPNEQLDHALASACAKQQIPFVNMRQTFVERALKQEGPFAGFANTSIPALGHLNIDGNRLVGRQLFESLQAMHLLPPHP